MASPRASKGKKTKKEQEASVDHTFTVGDYVLGTANVPWHQLRIDENLDHGQVRGVDNKNVADIYRNYWDNPPVQLELTVVKDQGASPFPLPLWQVAVWHWSILGGGLLGFPTVLVFTRIPVSSQS